VIRRYGPFLAIAALIAIIVVTGVWRHVELDELQRSHAQLRAFVRGNPAEGLVAYFGVYVVIAAGCLPGISLVSIAGGYLFGALAGGAVGLAGSVTGSMIVYAAVRSAFAEAVTRRSGPRLRAMEAALRRDAFGYLLSLKLMPVAPFPLANIAAGLAGVRPTALLFASLLGSAPLCFIYAGIGASLSRALDSGSPADHRLLQRPDMIWPLAGLTLLSVAALAWRLRRRSLPEPRP
jgi:uncharacterized membrane protein YdjX (TVP38/TMEM64 family)